MTRIGHVGGVGISLRTGDLIACQMVEEKQRIASETLPLLHFILPKHGLCKNCWKLSFMFIEHGIFMFRGLRGRERMIVGFTTTCAISAYHH